MPIWIKISIIYIFIYFLPLINSLLWANETPERKTQLVRGALIQTSQGYSLNDKLLILPKKDSDTPLNIDSRALESFVGQNVEIEALGPADERLEIQSIISTDLYSAIPGDILSPKLESTFFRKLSNGGLALNPNTEAEGLYGQTESKRWTLFQSSEASDQPKHALVISVAGSQGDDANSAFGHFAIGKAEVNPDQTLQILMANYYPIKNSKSLVPGNVPGTEYFGSLINGQSLYRPIFSLVIYDLPMDLADHFFESMKDVYEFLKQNPNFQPTFGSNCTTETLRCLEQNKAKSVSQKIRNQYFSKFKNWPKLQILVNLLFSPRSHFLPQSAFDRILSEITSQQEFLGQPITRADFIFHSQMISARPRGALAARSLMDFMQRRKQIKQRNQTNLKTLRIAECKQTLSSSENL